MNATHFCHINRLPTELTNVLELLPVDLWYLFSKAERRNGYIVVKSSYYSFTGRIPKRIDIAAPIIKACRTTGIPYTSYNNSVRKGAPGQKVEIRYKEQIPTNFNNK